jgi:hypothetical protein
MTDASCSNPPSCTQLGRIATLEAQHDHVLHAIGKMDEKLDRVITMLGRVEVLESKHLSHNEALARAFSRIELAERRLDETALKLNDLMSQIKGMTRAAVVLWTVMGGSVTYALIKLTGLQ